MPEPTTHPDAPLGRDQVVEAGLVGVVTQKMGARPVLVALNTLDTLRTRPLLLPMKPGDGTVVLLVATPLHPDPLHRQLPTRLVEDRHLERHGEHVIHM